jgi:hypothetical protein
MTGDVVFDGRSEQYRDQLGSFGGIYFRKFGPLAKGFVHEGHRHYQDHITSLMTGAVRVKYRLVNDLASDPLRSAVFFAPINFEIKANVYHEIEVLEDGTSYQCLFNNADCGDIPFSADEVIDG